MKRFQELLMKDIGWKLLSIAIAAIMWFMVINITQPVDTRAYSRPLQLENLEALTSRGLTIGNGEELKNTKITVKVKAQRTALDRLNQNPDWITASVDLSELAYAVNGDVVALPVNVTILGGNSYGISSKAPAVVEARVETLTTKEMPVQVEIIGNLESGIYLSQPTLSDETVKVSGPASLVNRVASVKAEINAEDLQATPEMRARLTCYDANGNIVKGVSTNVLEVTVSYALHDVKQVPIQIDIIGTPAAGYQVGEISCTPKYAEVTGSPEDLEKLLYLQLGSIDVSGRTTSASRAFSLTDYLPEGVSLKEGSPNSVQVVVTVEAQHGKQFTLDSSNLSLIGEEDGKTYTLGTAHVTISGDTGTLNALQPANLGGTVHVGGLTEGTHRVLIHLDLPSGLSASPVYIDVTVTGEAELPENE
ncbi:MAG: YbbR-like domain-containing protein [Anaerotignum sp.]